MNKGLIIYRFRDKVQTARDLYLKGIKLEDIIKEIGCSETSIWRWTKDIRRNPEPKELKNPSKDTVLLARKMYLDGIQIHEIAKQVNRCDNTINNWTKDIRKNPGATFEKGRVPYNKGGHHTKEELFKISAANSGENNPAWKGGHFRIKRKAAIRMGGNFSRQQWQELKEKYGFMCLCCKKTEPEIKLSLDHIIPVAKWDAYIAFHPEIDYKCNDIKNLQPLCMKCNILKSVKVVDYRKQEQHVD